MNAMKYSWMSCFLKGPTWPRRWRAALLDDDGKLVVAGARVDVHIQPQHRDAVLVGIGGLAELCRRRGELDDVAGGGAMRDRDGLFCFRAPHFGPCQLGDCLQLHELDRKTGRERE